MKFLIQTGLDREDNFVGVLGVLGEEGVEQLKRVVVWSAIKVSSVPESTSGVQRRLHGWNGILNGNWCRGTPGEA